MPGPAAVRALVDINVGVGSHGRKCCLHGIVGMVPLGSGDVSINGMDAVRQYDVGIHTVATCCGPHVLVCVGASSTVFINGRGAVRVDDMVAYCCGVGTWATGSGDVNIGG
jgi:hypothetical protein